jgi:hypothetical protein
MTDESTANTPPETKQDAQPQKKPEFTQDDLNEYVGKARTESKSQYEKELAKIKADHEKELKLLKMNEEERVKAEKEMELKKLNDELASSRRELRLKAAEAELAKNKLDTSFAPMLLADTDEETNKNITLLKKQAF